MLLACCALSYYGRANGAGSGTSRLTRQLFTESVLLALLSGCLGLVFASLGVHALIAFGPPDVAQVNSNAFDGAPALSRDGTELYFSRSAPTFPATCPAHHRRGTAPKIRTYTSASAPSSPDRNSKLTSTFYDLDHALSSVNALQVEARGIGRWVKCHLKVFKKSKPAKYPGNRKLVHEAYPNSEDVATWNVQGYIV
jgi:hypothetical protein